MCFFSKTQIAHLIEFNGAAFFDLRGEMCSLLNNPLTLTVNFNHVEVPKLKNVLIVDLFPRENFSFPGPFGACPGPNKKKKKLGQFSAQREALPFGTECGNLF
jgi:hypothetical protein